MYNEDLYCKIVWFFAKEKYCAFKGIFELSVLTNRHDQILL